MLNDKRGVIAMSGGTIFGLQPFEPKRQLVLPCRGGEITLYVLDGKVFTTMTWEGELRLPDGIQVVHFGGWSLGFKNTELDIPVEHLVNQHGIGGYEHYVLDVIFRLVSSDTVGQTAEVVAISYDDCGTFHENELSTLVREYEDMEVLTS